MAFGGGERDRPVPLGRLQVASQIGTVGGDGRDILGGAVSPDGGHVCTKVVENLLTASVVPGEHSRGGDGWISDGRNCDRGGDRNRCWGGCGSCPASCERGKCDRTEQGGS